jgi:hypothetical protein
MPDIREVLKALDTDDKANWLHHRTEMRRSFIQAHNSTVGIAQWTEEDDAFLDMIDIKLALLFDRSGRMLTTKTIVEKSDGDQIEELLIQANANLKPTAFVSPASAMMANVDAHKTANEWAKH